MSLPARKIQCSVVVIVLVVFTTSHGLAGEIHDAISRGDLATVRRLVARNPALVNAEDKTSGRPLNVASDCGNVEIVRFLLDHKADPKAAGGEYKRRPIFETRNPTVAKLLAEHGADLEAADGDKETPLQNASSRDWQTVARVLADKGAKVDAESAARLGWTSHITKMLRRTPNLARSNKDLLFAAAGSGRTGTLQLLLKHGADPNRDFGFVNVLGPYTPLTDAVTNGHFETAKLLCESGASPNVSAGRNHPNLLRYAIAYLDARFLKLMLKHKADFRKSEALHVVAALGGAKDSLYGQWVAQPTIPDWEDRQVLVKARLLIDARADVNARREDGATPLLTAAIVENVKLRELLLKNGAKLDFYTACALGDAAAAGKMLKANPKLLNRAKPPLGWSPLHWAARSGNVQLVQLLLARGADVNAKAPRLQYFDQSGFEESFDYARDKSKGDSPVMVALRRGRTAVVRVLIEKGADLCGTDENGMTLLMVAAEKHNVEAIRLLVTRKADVNQRTKVGRTALNYAGDDKATVAFLLKSGADANCGGGDDAPIRWAANDVARMLYEHGAKIDPVIASRLNLRDKVAKFLDDDPKLLYKEFKPPALNDEGRLIEIAAGAGAFDVVKLLAERGALRPQKGVRIHPLHAAASEGHVAVVAFLLERGVPLESKREGKTVMHAAAVDPHPKVVKLLLERGANVDARDSDGNTPLHVVGGDEWQTWFGLTASEIKGNRKNQQKVVRLLLKAGAKVDARNGRGRTPLHLAAAKGQVEVAELLLKAGASVNLLDWAVETPLGITEKPRRRFLLDEIDRRPVAALLRKHGGVK